MTKIVWNKNRPPKDRRILMIVAPEPPLPDKPSLSPDIVIGHWHLGRKIYVPVTVPSGSNPSGYRTGLEVTYWAEIPDLPAGTNLRPLSLVDTRG
jgi:hypothetical protein